MSFIFSNIHNWQGDKAVAQILVFTDREAKQLFDTAFAKRVEEHGIEDASDSGIGAAYRLRAVKNSSNQYLPVIRSGAHGGLLWEGLPIGNKDSALKAAVNRLFTVLLNHPAASVRGVHFYLATLTDEIFAGLEVTATGNYEFT
jgi:hypothetical protein